MVKVPNDNLLLENVQITYRNFAGAAGQFNPAGIRTYSVILENMEEAQAIEALGWKVKYSKLKEDGSEPDFPAHMPITVKYHPQLPPPRVKMITSRGITSMGEPDIDILDFMSIKKCDMTLRPYHWKHKLSGNEGVKNMCSSIYITILEDALELKYADLPEISASQQKAIGGSNHQRPFEGEIEDMGEIEDPQFALESGRGF
jgi:hypothetical protein